MDIHELAKLAKAKKQVVQDDPDAQLARLDRKILREKTARREAEETIEESSRRLYLANQALDKANEDLEQSVLDLNDAMSRLTSAEVKRKATIVTLIVAMVLFVISEFAIEPRIEHLFTNPFYIILSKVAIFALLIPIELLTTRIFESNISKSSDLNEKMYEKLLKSAYDDGIITDMERTLLTSSAQQFGISPAKARLIEKNVKIELGVD